MIEALKESFNLIFSSVLFRFWLRFVVFFISYKITFRFFHYMNSGAGFTLREKPGTREDEITFCEVYDNGLLDLMKKYDDMEKKHHKHKKHGKHKLKQTEEK